MAFQDPWLSVNPKHFVDTPDGWRMRCECKVQDQDESVQCSSVAVVAAMGHSYCLSCARQRLTALRSKKADRVVEIEKLLGEGELDTVLGFSMDSYERALAEFVKSKELKPQETA